VKAARPRFSLPLREAGKFADVDTNREGKKPGRSRLQSRHQSAQIPRLEPVREFARDAWGERTLLSSVPKRSRSDSL
jgi:hypothetical protein